MEETTGAFAAQIDQVTKWGQQIWDNLGAKSIELFTTDPNNLAASGLDITAGGGLSSLPAVINAAFEVVRNVAIPLAIIFGLFAIIKMVLSTPAEHQARTFLMSALKLGIIIAIVANMTTILRGVSAACTGVVKAVEQATPIVSAWGYEGSHLNSSARMQTINETLKEQYDQIDKDYVEAIGGAEAAATASINPLAGAFSALGNGGNVFELASVNTRIGICYIAAFIYNIILLACAIIVFKTAFTRLFKPLIVVPFSTVAVATAAGGPEASRTMSSFVRAYIGYILAGALMILAITLSPYISNMLDAILPTHIGSVAAANNAIMNSGLYLSLLEGYTRLCLPPIITTGLVVGCDSIMTKFFGL